MDDKLLANINLLILIVFTNLVLLTFGRITFRFFEYKNKGLEPPRLLRRDLVFFAGLSIPFLGILFFRTFDVQVSGTPWYPVWVIFSGCLAIAGLGYWTYYEFFEIEK